MQLNLKEENDFQIKESQVSNNQGEMSYKTILSKIKTSLLEKFQEKKEDIIQKEENTWLESEIQFSAEMSIEEECQIDYNLVFLRRSTFAAIKSNYEKMNAN